MKRISILAAMVMAATTMMAQTAKKSFTLDDLMPGGSTYWNLQPQYMFSTWWGEKAVELTVDAAKEICKGNERKVLFTASDLNAVLGDVLVRTCTQVVFPYEGEPVVKVQTPKEIVLVDFVNKQVVWRGAIQQGAEDLVWNAKSRNMAYCIGSLAKCGVLGHRDRGGILFSNESIGPIIEHTVTKC